MGYGIGRVPADVDSVGEQVAQAEAATIGAPQRVAMGKCAHCKAEVPATWLMTSARGSVCPDCYDTCEEV